jgi:hypothetical protein
MLPAFNHAYVRRVKADMTFCGANVRFWSF